VVSEATGATPALSEMWQPEMATRTETKTWDTQHLKATDPEEYT